MAKLCYLSLAYVPLQEFSIEIPDAEADEIATVQQGACSARVLPFRQLTSCSAIDYIAKTPEGMFLIIYLHAKGIHAHCFTAQ